MSRTATRPRGLVGSRPRPPKPKAIAFLVRHEDKDRMLAFVDEIEDALDTRLDPDPRGFIFAVLVPSPKRAKQERRRFQRERARWRADG